jgi:hypothetical protein
MSRMMFYHAAPSPFLAVFLICTDVNTLTASFSVKEGGKLRLKLCNIINIIKTEIHGDSYDRRGAICTNITVLHETKLS